MSEPADLAAAAPNELNAAETTAAVARRAPHSDGPAERTMVAATPPATQAPDDRPEYLREPATTERLHHTVWTLAWPSVLTMLLQTVNGMMDTLFVGHIRPNAAAALAATGVGGQLNFLLISLAMGISVGTTALVARFTGARQHESSSEATGQSISLALCLGVLFGTLAYVSRGAVVGAMLSGDANVETRRLCLLFLGPVLAAAPPLFVMNTFMSAFRGLGDTRTPMVIGAAGIAVHISCNWLLIYGHLGLPRLGVRGAGTAYAISVFLSAVLYIIALVKVSPLGDALTRRHLRMRLEWMVRILRIGIPASIQAVVRNLAMMSFVGLLARTMDGASGVAALQIGVRAEALAFMPGFGYSVAASALVGQSLGARDPRRAERSGWIATLQAVCVMSFMALCFYTGANLLAQLFTADPNVQRLGADYLRVNAFCEPFLGLGMVLTGALQGAGDTMRPTYITFFTMWLLRLPLAEWLMFTCHLNAHGAWISMCVTTVVGGFMTAWLFWSGKWKRVKV